MHQYSYCRAYAEKIGATLQTPKWIGQELFCLDDPPIEGKGMDLCGYFQTQKHIDLLSRAKLKQWFCFQDRWYDLFPKKRSYAAAHVRRGDYLTYQNVYCVINEESYTNAMKQHGIDLELVWVKEENAKSTGTIPFLEDFFTLINADVLLRANSTFSWWASVLGEGKTYSPLVENKTGPHTVQFVEGNHPMLVHPSHCGGEGGDLWLPA